MDLKEKFDAAVAASKTLTKKPGNDILLQLYSLFKQGTDGDINIEPPTNMFDIVNKAKYDAWNKLKGTSKEQAQQAYIDLVAQLKGA